jgi:group I intron endonuclease
MTGDDKPTKYVNGKIYKLVNDVDDKIYVGSTVKPLNIRFSEHKQDANRFPNRPAYDHFNKMRWSNVRIELIEKYPCESKAELHAHERVWYDKLNPMLNVMRPFVTEEEAHEKKIEYDRKNGNKSWTCEICNCTYRQDNKSHHLHSKKHLSKFLENTLVLTEASETDYDESTQESSTES